MEHTSSKMKQKALSATIPLNHSGSARIHSPRQLKATFAKSCFALAALFFVLVTGADSAMAQSWNYLGTEGFSAGQVYYSGIAIAADGTPYVAYEDNANSNKCSVMKYNGSSWVAVAGSPVSTGAAGYPSVAIAPDGTLYVGFLDQNLSNKETVMKFNGSSWSVVGTTGFTPGEADQGTLQVGPDGTLYVGFEDAYNGQKMSVMKFNGTGWVNVGTAGFSAGTISGPCFSISPDGTLFAAYGDQSLSNYGAMTVMTFNGTSWVNVGTPGFTAAYTGYQSMAVGADDKPVVSYSSSGVFSLKFDGTNWNYLGGSVYPDGAYYTKTVIGSNGNPYVLFRAGESGAWMETYNGTSWVEVGSTNFSGFFEYPNLAVGPTGNIYFGFQDDNDGNKMSVMEYTPPPTVSLTSSGVCPGATLTVTSSATPSEIVWNLNGTPVSTVVPTVPPGTSMTYTTTTGGNYSATIYTTSSGTGTTNAITINPTPAISGGSNTAVCLGSSTTLTATGGATYSWAPSTGLSASSGASVTADPSSTTAYTVTGVNAGGCSNTGIVTVTVNSIPTISGGSNVSICPSSSTTLTGSGGVTYSWAPSTGLSATSGTSVTAEPASTTIYTVTGASAAGCSNTAMVTVTALLPTNAGSISGTNTINLGGVSYLTDATTGGVWSSSNTAVATVATDGTVTSAGIGTASISYTVTDACGTATTTEAVTVISGPTANACIGSNITLSLLPAGGTWHSTSTAIATVSSGGIVTGVAAGVTTVSYTTTLGSIIITTVTVLSKPATITGTLSVCQGLTTTLGETSAGGTWSNSNANTTIVGNIVTGVTSGTSTISYTFATGCYNTATVTVNQTPAAISGTTSLCPGTSTTLGETTTGGVWTSSAATIATIGSATGLLAATAAGAATISYTHGTCSKTVTVSVNALPLAITGTASVCSGLATALTDVTAGGAWSSGNANATVGATGIVSGVTAGSALITYTSVSGCIKTITVTINQTPAAISGLSAICAGTTLALGETTTGGVWASSTGTIATIATTGTVTGIGAGTSNISYTSGGCRSTGIVTVNAIPAAITGTAYVCSGLTTTLAETVTGGAWSSSNANATVGASGIVSGVTAGSALITYTSASGCIRTTTVTINQTPAAISGLSAICTGTTLALGETTTGGIWASSLTATATVASTGIVTGVAVGVSTISYTLGSCRSTGIVTVNAVPATITGTAYVCSGLTTTLAETVTGGIWSSSNSNATVSAGIVTGATSGTATISYTSGAGCNKTVTVTVNQSPAAITGGVTTCSGTALALGETITGGTWSSSSTATATIATTGTVTGVAAGVATISYTLGSCHATEALTVVVSPAAISGSTSVCSGSTVTLSDANPGGIWACNNSNLAVSISGIVSGAAAGTSVVSYTFATGCYKTIVVTVNPTPVAISGGNSICSGLTLGLSDATAGGTWASSSAAVAAIATTGVVTGAAAGTATISYTLGSCRATVMITVNALPVAITGTAVTCTGVSATLADLTTGGTWSTASGNASIGTPGVGVVTGVSAGTAIITYQLPSGCIKTDIVTVNQSPASITGGGAICVGSTTALTDGTISGTWASSSASVASIATTGVVTGVLAGTTSISYTYGSCRSITIITVDALPGTISGAAAVCIGLTTTLTDAVTGGNWSSANGTIAATGSSAGIVTGLVAGTTTIIYTLPSGCSKSHNITVNPDPAGILGTFTVCKGATTALSDVTTGSNGWSSSSTSVATVTNAGIVTGVAAAGGTATITYTLTTGCYTTTTVTVNPLPNATISGPATLSLSGGPVTLTDVTIGGTWTSTHTTVATVGSSSGIVTAVASSGSTTISYTVSSNGCTAIGTHTLTATSAPPPHSGGPATSGVETINVSDVVIYPNPTRGSFTIKTEVPGKFYLYTIDGKETGEYIVTEGATFINMPDGLATGIYIGRFAGDDGSIKDVKLMYQP